MDVDPFRFDGSTVRVRYTDYFGPWEQEETGFLTFPNMR